MSTKPKTPAAPPAYVAGEGDDHDPDYLAAVTPREEVAKWLDGIEPCLMVTRPLKNAHNGPAKIHVFPAWNRKFYAAARKDFDDGQTLAGKRLVVIKHMYKSLAEDTADLFKSEQG